MAKITVSYPDKHLELVKILLERTHSDIDMVFYHTMVRFVNNNLDLLTPSELERFQSILLTKQLIKEPKEKTTHASQAVKLALQV
jgi:hypothetical protein